MTLSPEQKQAVANWVSTGDSLSAIQRKLSEQFKISLTYRDVRFLVDDLNLELQDAAPKLDTSDITKAPFASDKGAPAAPARPLPAEKKGFFDKAKEKLGLAKNEDGAPTEAEQTDADEDDLPTANGGAVSVSVDKVNLIPGAIASGTVTFSDGVTGKWIIDNQGRPGFTEISQPGYRPSPPDAQAFMQELSRAIQQRGY